MSTMRSAQLNPVDHDWDVDSLQPAERPHPEAPPAALLRPGFALEPASAASVLKQQVAERLAAHRSKRGRMQGAQTALPIEMPAPADASGQPKRSARVAAAVAERYAQTQSYRDFLAAEAERAIQQADAAAEVAARSARAIVQAQQQLLAELEFWDAGKAADSSPNEDSLESARSRPTEFEPTQETASSTAAAAEAPGPIFVAASQPETLSSVMTAERTPPGQTAKTPFAPVYVRPSSSAATPVTTAQVQGLTVRLYEDVRPRDLSPYTTQASRTAQAQRTNEMRSEHEFAGLDAFDLDALHEALNEEISFRRSPVFEPNVPAELLPANLIEFPRQLVAARKVRPRIAEGPLRDEETPQSPQLRIFEVEAVQLSTQPAQESSAPEWASIRLGAQAVSQPVPSPDTAIHSTHIPETAPVQLRLMASLVDACAIFATFLGFLAAFAETARQLPTGLPAAIASIAVLTTLYVLYQLLFFSLGEATPGMRYARIGLCTLTDENPTRASMRRRILCVLLSAAPLGLGFLWAFLDDDGLAWHDRLSRMYQRAY